MEEIFIGLLNSDHPESVKEGVIEVYFIPAAKNDNAPEVIIAVLKVTLEIAVSSNKTFAQRIGKRVFLEWAKHHPSELEAVFRPSVVQYLLANDASFDKVQVLNLIKECLDLLRYVNKILLSEICYAIQGNCLDIVDNGSIETVKALVLLLLCYKECIPSKASLQALGSKILNVISRMSLPQSEDEHVAFKDAVRLISLFYKKIYFDTNRDFMDHFLCMLVSQLTQTDWEVSIALGGLIDALNISPTPEIVKQLLSNDSITSRHLSILLERLIGFLEWPDENFIISDWVVILLKDIAVRRRFSLLIEVSVATITRILHFLTYGVNKRGAFLVFKYILLSYQHSPDLFHKIVEHVPSAIAELEAQLPTGNELLIEIAEVLFTVMYHHAGFPQLYDPLLLAIKHFPKPSNERMNQLLSENAWLQAKCGYTISLPHCLSRSETGKTGLINLGNTCYMNSVLQALYSTNKFAAAVLKSLPTPNQIALLNLQKLFAFLTHSQRVAITAEEFFQASCPPWFKKNHQQDCSEYLRYLMDCLHEQEKKDESSLKKQNVPFLNSSGVANIETDHTEQSLSPPTTTVCSKGADVSQSLVRSFFAGHLISSYQCLNCDNTTEQSEIFIDLHLAFPPTVIEKSGLNFSVSLRKYTRQVVNEIVFSKGDPALIPKGNPASILGDDNLDLQDLLTTYFDSEILEGENKYHCENCNNLTDAIRTIRIIEAPQHLILTLLRFKYDPVLQQHSKIQRDVHYPFQLKLPVFPRKSSETDQISSYDQLYHLYAVVIHSGVSSDSGHYYTYAKCKSSFNLPNNQFEGDERDGSRDRWYLFNDSSVSFCSPSSFHTVTERFPKDTAYVLFYRKQADDENELPEEDPRTVMLRQELRSEVEQDNLRYLKEEENRQSRRSNIVFKNSKFDDNNRPGGCGGGGGFSDFTQGNFPRLVS